MFPILNPSPSSLPRTIPLGCPSAPAPSIQYHASNLDWQFVSYMILYMFQCHSPKSSHPRPLPESKRLFYIPVSLLLSRIQGYRSVQFSSVQLLSHVQLFSAQWMAACQASLSITNSQSLLKLMSIVSVMPSNHLILCHPLLLMPSILPSIRVFSSESVLHIR